MRINFNPAIYTIPVKNRSNHSAPMFTGQYVPPKTLPSFMSCTIIADAARDRSIKETFQLETSLDYRNSQYFFDKTEKFEIRDYDKIRGCLTHNIEKLADKPLINAVDRTANISSRLKRKLDAKFGKDEYVFVSVGTRPSLVAKAFECMGVETKYIPVPKKKKWERCLKEHDFALYGNFLKSQGLTSNVMKTKSKKYLFYDYTDGTGRLENFKQLMKDRYGIPEECCEFRSLNRDLRTIKLNTDLVEGYIKNYLVNPSFVDKYTSIADLPDNSYTKSTFKTKNLTRHDVLDAKLFNYLLMAKLVEKRLLENIVINYKP